jgi:tripartite-type tricarboxylate transporter receptor subunit TctC
MAPWVGIIVPAKTPPEIVARLSQETLAVMREPEVVKLLNDQQVTPFTLAGGEFEQLIRRDQDKWATVVKNAGIKPE